MSPCPPRRYGNSARRLRCTRRRGKKLAATLWGFERELTIIGPDARPLGSFSVKTDPYASEIQPFDRLMPNYEVYLHRLTIPAAAAEGYYLLSPQLELAVLDYPAQARPLWNASQPIELKAGEAVFLPMTASAQTLIVESAVAASLRVQDVHGKPLIAKISGNRAEFALTGGRAGMFGSPSMARAGCD